MIGALTREQQCLLALSRSVWNRRGAAKRSKLPCNEETLTENLLLDLKLTYPGDVVIVPFGKAQEAQNGADWAWAFQSADRAHSQPMLVQAKRLDDRERRYDGIKRAIGKTKPPVRQIDRLIDTAHRLGFPPVYAFYNHLDKSLRVPADCGSLEMAGLPNMIESWGITLAAAEVVRAALNDETFTTHREHSRPLHCLLCSGGGGVKPPRGSAESASRGIRELRSMGRGAAEFPFDTDGRDGPWEGLPPIFALAARLTEVADPLESDAVIAKLREQFPGVAGAVIFRDGRESSRD